MAVASFLLATATASATVSVTNGLSHERPVHAGASYNGVITLRNSGEEAAEVKVFRVDYAFASDGSNVYADPGTLPRSNAGWVGLPTEQVTVPPRGSLNVDFVVLVPDDSQLTGTYWSMVMVEPLAADAFAAGRPARGDLRVRTVVRYGVQIVSDVVGGAAKELELFDPGLVEAEGRRLFTVDVRNTGEVWLRPAVWLQLFDEAGGRLQRLEAERARIYPGCSVRYRIDMTGVAPGTYLALGAADAGSDGVWGVNLELKVD